MAIPSNLADHGPASQRESDRSAAPGYRPWLTGKDLEWLAYLYGLRYLVAGLPLAWLPRFAAGIEPFYQVAGRRWRRMVQDRMNGIFLLRAVDVDAVRTSRRFISRAVRRAIDDLIMDRLEQAGWPFPVTVEGLKHLQEARASQRGAIILTGHFFGNRLARRYLAAQGYPMMSVRHFEPPDRFMGRVGRRWLQPRYIDFLHQVIRHEVALQDRERSLKIFKHIRQGGLANLNMEPAFSKAAAQMPFFGRDWLFPTGIYRIARMADCAVVPMLGLGDSRGLRIQFAPPVTLEPEDRGEQHVDGDLARFVPMLESWILQYPDQWELWDRL